jgi:ribosome biogenesis GTPase A
MAAVVAAVDAPKKAGKKGAADPAAAVPKFGRVRANLKMGVLGLPNVGKSSLFNLMTEQAVAAEDALYQIYVSSGFVIYGKVLLVFQHI